MGAHHRQADKDRDHTAVTDTTVIEHAWPRGPEAGGDELGGRDPRGAQEVRVGGRCEGPWCRSWKFPNRERSLWTSCTISQFCSCVSPVTAELSSRFSGTPGPAPASMCKGGSFQAELSSVTNRCVSVYTPWLAPTHPLGVGGVSVSSWGLEFPSRKSTYGLFVLASPVLAHSWCSVSAVCLDGWWMGVE